MVKRGGEDESTGVWAVWHQTHVASVMSYLYSEGRLVACVWYTIAFVRKEPCSTVTLVYLISLFLQPPLLSLLPSMPYLRETDNLSPYMFSYIVSAFVRLDVPYFRPILNSKPRFATLIRKSGWLEFGSTVRKRRCAKLMTRRTKKRILLVKGKKAVMAAAVISSHRFERRA